MLTGLLKSKPGNEVQVLTENAKTGIEAITTLVEDRNNLAKEVQHLNSVCARLTMENEQLRSAFMEMQTQRDFWMRTNAKLEASLNQLGIVVQTMRQEFYQGGSVRGPNQSGAHSQSITPDNTTQQIASRFAPEMKNAKSVA